MGKGRSQCQEDRRWFQKDKQDVAGYETLLLTSLVMMFQLCVACIVFWSAVHEHGQQVEGQLTVTVPSLNFCPARPAVNLLSVVALFVP